MFDNAIENQADHVRAYFGMRKISLGRVGSENSLRPLLNDKFVFHMGMLDQVRLSHLAVESKQKDTQTAYTHRLTLLSYCLCFAGCVL